MRPAWVLGAILLLPGCFGASRESVPSRHIEPRCDPESYAQEEVNRVARGREIDPVWREMREAYASGRMSDQQYALLQARLHAAGMSALRAQEMAADMGRARSQAKGQAGLETTDTPGSR